MRPTVTCGSCEGKGVYAEQHACAVEYLACMDCMGLGQFLMVPVGSLVVEKVPCDCDGGVVEVQRRDEYPSGTDLTNQVSWTVEACLSCDETGMVWPEWANAAIGTESLRSLKEHTPPRYLDALLAAQEDNE